MCGVPMKTLEELAIAARNIGVRTYLDVKGEGKNLTARLEFVDDATESPLADWSLSTGRWRNSLGWRGNAENGWYVLRVVVVAARRRVRRA